VTFFYEYVAAAVHVVVVASGAAEFVVKKLLYCLQIRVVEYVVNLDVAAVLFRDYYPAFRNGLWKELSAPLMNYRAEVWI